MQKIFIWGTGFIAAQVLSQESVFERYDVKGFIDNDLGKCGQLFWHKRVYAPEILNEVYPDKIIILTDCYEEIKKQIILLFQDMEGIIENKNFFYKETLLKRYRDSDDREIQDVLNYIKRNDMQIFNYSFTNKYRNLDIDVFFDSNCGMYFVYHAERKLYFAKFLDTVEKVQEYYRNILIEQDAESPHRYRDVDFNIREGDVVVDAGVAEGNFSLEIVEKASRIYMIETDEAWIEAIQQTFKEYRDKVVILKKFITSMDDGKFATLGSLINEPVNFIKMDIEGNEWDALLGAEELIKKSKDLKCAVCSYHRDFDEVLIKNVMAGYGLSCSATSGYMWFPYMIRNTYVSTRLCRGIIRGIKKESDVIQKDTIGNDSIAVKQ